MSNGWAKFHRRFLDSDLWLAEPFTKGQAWVDLFILANHADGVSWLRGVEVKVKRGQTARSELTLAKRWKWSRNKVRRFLKWLETKQQIKQQKNNVTSIITILNYEVYQSGDTQNDTPNDTPERHQKDTKRYTNKKKENNEKKKKKDIKENHLGIFKKPMPIPDNYSIQKEHIDYAKLKGFSEEVAKDEFEMFVSHHLSKGTLFKNWYAGYQKWIQNKIKWNSDKEEKAWKIS